MRQRTQITNAIRSHLAEFGIVCSATIGTGKSVNQDWKEQSRQRMIDAARQESKGFLKPPRVNQDGVLIDA
jgi:hypothetical protein